jgi:hypothetical protein
MISDPKLPFNSAPTGLETRSGLTPGVSSEASSETVPDSRPQVPLTRATASEREHSPVRRPISGVYLWARRLGVLLFVFLCATVGVMLMIVPWRPEWSENPLLLSYPALHDLATTGFIRGMVTGLGLLNVWIGFWEALQYRED